MLLMPFVGCQRAEQVDATYGRRRGYPAVSSVNGTSVIARVFQQAGFRTTSTSRLSKSVSQSQVVFWAPDNFMLPEEPAYEFFESWLYDESGRTLIYVARDYDAAIEYYRELVENGPVENVEGYQRGLADAHTRFELQRQGFQYPANNIIGQIPGTDVPEEQQGRWFGVKRESPTDITELSGPWSLGVDARKTKIRTWSELTLPDGLVGTASDVGDDELAETNESPAENDVVDERPVEPLAQSEAEADIESEAEADIDSDAEMEIESDEEMETESEETEVLWEVIPLLTGNDGRLLAIEIRRPFWGGSRVVVVVNGSWLLNLPLVNHEHRKLAGHLVNSCGPPGRVVFLETGPGGARVSKGSDNPFWALLKQPPLGAILMHLFALGMLYCFAAFPIFGRARRLTTETITDFGKHIIALGKQMSVSRDGEYARGRLNAYQQFVRRDSGASHLPENVNPKPRKAL